MYYDYLLNCLPLQWNVRSLKARTKSVFFIALSLGSTTAPDKWWVLNFIFAYEIQSKFLRAGHEYFTF